MFQCPGFVKITTEIGILNFPKLLESKEILKIERSKVCVWGGVAKGRIIKLSLPVFVNIQVTLEKGVRRYPPQHQEDHPGYLPPHIGNFQLFQKSQHSQIPGKEEILIDV